MLEFWAVWTPTARPVGILRTLRRADVLEGDVGDDPLLEKIHQLIRSSGNHPAFWWVFRVSPCQPFSQQGCQWVLASIRSGRSIGSLDSS